MAKVVVLGAGISGHTSAAYLKKKLGKDHEVIMVTPNSYYQWVPSNIWVGVGRMNIDQVRFKLKPVYEKWGIDYKQAKAISIHPEGDQSTNNSFVSIEYTDPSRKGDIEKIEYDYLVNATGPKLNFEATEGLGPDKFTNSVCTYSHASESWESLKRVFFKLGRGEKQKILIGTGHPTATCQGAAFEYILNVAFEINRRGFGENAELKWITNEYELGDFGMGGAFIKKGGYITSSKVFSESIFAENGINWIKRAGVTKVEEGKVHYEDLNGEVSKAEYDFAMLIPGFSGVGLTAEDKNGDNITPEIFAPNGFMKVDADYSQKDFAEWRIEDWPEIYQNPTYDNIYATGIAFAPPHSISKPMENKNGTKIFPAPPRTGMPSGVIGKIVALNITERILKNKKEHKHKASMGKMGAACIVSAGYGMTKGVAATMTLHPIVPDWAKYPEWGRDINYTVGEVGLASHWMKFFMHYMFLHKAKGYPFWWLLPE
ncbi:MAG: FAD/NAD(P)-binding oxidoreductase [Acidobacteriota bacterium]